MYEATYQVIHYIQKTLYDGRKPDENGKYVYQRKELAEGAGISLSTLNRCKYEIQVFLEDDFDLERWAKIKEYRGESLFTEVTFERVGLTFKRNPLTQTKELSYLWGLPPLNDTFVYDVFDEQHRRRCGGNKMEFEAIPWSWNADEHEGERRQALKDIAAHQTTNCQTEKKPRASAEQERIRMIERYGGMHIKKFARKSLTYDLCMAAVKDNGSALEYVPEEFLTPELCLAAVERSGFALRFVPAEMKTEALCLAACRTYGVALKYVPESMRTKEMYQAAVKTSGEALELVPEDERTPEMYLDSACEDKVAFRFIPNDFVTPDFCAEVVFRTGAYRFQDLPKKYKTPKTVEKVIEKRPEVFWDLPREYCSETVCKSALQGLKYPSFAAMVQERPEIFGKLPPALYDREAAMAFVTSDYYEKQVVPIPGYDFNCEIKGHWMVHKKEKYYMPGMLQWRDVAERMVAHDWRMTYDLPAAFRDAEMYKIALKQGGLPLSMVPENLLTKEIYQTAFEADSSCIRSVPKEMITREMCYTAAKENGILVPGTEELWTKEICLAAVSRTGTSIQKIPPELRDEAIYAAAVSCREQRLKLENVPEQWKTEKVCLAAVKRYGCELENVPNDMITSEMAEAAVRQTGFAIQYVPRELLTDDLCINALHYSGNLRDIPVEARSERVCVAAVERNLQEIDFVPEQNITKEMIERVSEKWPATVDRYLPARLRTEEYLTELFQKYPQVAHYIKKVRN